jgi:hypothetical protein
MKTTNVTTLYPTPSYELSSTPTISIDLQGLPVATLTDTTVTALHTDHLASTVATTNLSGHTTALLSYYAYGGLRVYELYGEEVLRRFTGYQRVSYTH